MSRKDFDTNKYLELAKSLKLDSMDDINYLFKNLSKAIIENSLNAEMDDILVMINGINHQEINQIIIEKDIQIKRLNHHLGNLILKYQEIKMQCLNLL